MTDTIGIAGAGTIATGLATVTAPHRNVVIYQRPGRHNRRLAALADSNPNVTIVNTPDDLAPCPTVIEAISENLDEKLQLLSYLTAQASDSTIIATTTSSLQITTLAAATTKPERFVGFHVFNPVQNMELIELCLHPNAPDDVTHAMTSLVTDLGKTPIVVPDTQGFIVNKLLFPYLLAAVQMMTDTGLPATDIDDAMKLGAHHPIGPLALLDLIGLDTAEAISNNLGLQVPHLLRDMVQEGKLGRKTRAGLTL